MTQGRLQVSFPTQGWRQFLTSRKEILDAYDKAREHARAHEIETYHGRVAEGEIRKWLADFLPKRYGVTSGYVISPAMGSDVKAPHFDVIIYDQMEAPILWNEDNPDNSEQGRSRAIPVEHVLAILEVKSSLSSKIVKEAIEHLGDLASLMQATDEPGERYRLHLPPSFVCGMVFIELREEHKCSEAILSAVLEGQRLRGFCGGIVLRHPGPADGLSAGIMRLADSKEPVESTFKGPASTLGGLAMCKSVQVAEGRHRAAMIISYEAAFAQFAFDLIAMMQGKYRPGFLSSPYGLGSSTHEDTW